jgi:hypothetical protein
VKDHRHSASQCGSSAFESEALPQHGAPTAKRAFLTDPRQEHSRGFIKERAQLAITASRDVAVVIDLFRLEASGCEPEPGSNNARPFEGIGLLQCGDIRHGRDGSDARHAHEHATGRIPLH